MGLVTALRPSKITGQRHHYQNRSSVLGNLGSSGRVRNNKIDEQYKEIEVLDVSYIDEIDDQNVLLALKKLRQTTATRSKSALKTKSKGHGVYGTPPRFPTTAGAVGTLLPEPAAVSVSDSSSDDSSDESAAIVVGVGVVFEKKDTHSVGGTFNENENNNTNKSSSRCGCSTVAAPAVDVDANTNNTYSRIPASVRNMVKNLPYWERIRSAIKRLSEMDCLSEENMNTNFDADSLKKYGFADFLMDDNEGGTTFDDTFATEGNTTFDRTTFDSTFDGTILSSLLEGINASIVHVQRKNEEIRKKNQTHTKKGYAYADTDFDVDAFDVCNDNNVDGVDGDYGDGDESEFEDDHDPHFRSIFDGSTLTGTVDSQFSSFLKASTISYEAASDDLEYTTNETNHDDHDDDDDDDDYSYDDDEEEDENNNILTRDRKHHHHHKRSTNSPLQPVNLDVELGLQERSEDAGIPKLLMVIPSARHNHPLDESSADTSRDFLDDDSFSLLTTDLELMTVSSSLKSTVPSSPSKTIRSVSPSKTVRSSSPSKTVRSFQSQHSKLLPSRSRSRPSSSFSNSNNKPILSSYKPTSGSSNTKKNKFWKRFIV